MTSELPRRRTAGRARVVVTVAAPDGDVRSRGLAGWLQKCAPSQARGDVTVALVSDGRMRVLNRTFRGKDYATDVLSFPMVDQPGCLGDIVIATGIAKRQAEEAGHTVATELRILALHGLLHLLGYDHESDVGRMARVEARLRKKGGLKEGLIERGRAAKSR